MNKSIIQRLVSLASDSKFIELENSINEPNIFKIIGRTHLERAHSCFWGWLLDPNGSHGLNEYVIQQILLLLLHDQTLHSSDYDPDLIKKLLSDNSFKDLEVRPNENNSKEVSVSGVGRFDIYLNGKTSLNNKEIIIIFELKVDSPIRQDQSIKYTEWLYKEHSDKFFLPIYLLPTLNTNSKSTVGDDKWFCISYQLIYDRVLNQVLKHPNLNSDVKPFIEQYLKALRTTMKGVRMAITNKEKDLAVSLYEKHSDAIDELYEILINSDVVDYSKNDTTSSSGRGSGIISVEINGVKYSGNSVSALYEKVLKMIVDENILQKIGLPWGTGTKRYLVSNEENPIHPSGRPFFKPVQYSGYTIESHSSRSRGVKLISELCEKLNLEFTLIEL